MTKEEGATRTVAEVLGRTARVIRGDRKIELVARAARSAGLNWGTGRIADLEAGRVSPTLPTLLMLCLAFSDLLDRPMTLADLLAGDGPVALNASTTVDLADLRAALGGQAVGGGVPPVGPIMARLGADMDALPDVRATVRERLATEPFGHMRLIHPRARKVRDSFLEADYRMAASLGLDLDRAAELMHALWKRSFSDERDRRGGPGANPQKRGRISRQLKAELKRRKMATISSYDTADGKRYRVRYRTPDRRTDRQARIQDQA